MSPLQKLKQKPSYQFLGGKIQICCILRSFYKAVRKSYFLCCFKLPTKVGYSSKNEEIFPYCPDCLNATNAPNGPKLQIYFMNSAKDLSPYYLSRAASLQERRREQQQKKKQITQKTLQMTSSVLKVGCRLCSMNSVSLKRFSLFI